MESIKVIGTGCEKCTQLFENTASAVQRLGLEVTVEKVEDLMEIVRLGVTALPAVLAEGTFIVAGEVADENTIALRLKALYP